MALTSNGLEIKRLPEVLEDLSTELKTQLGSDIDLSSSSLLGIINAIYATAIADQWSLAEAVYAAFNINAAEGKQLDDLVALVGIARLAASPTVGDIEFKGDEGVVIPVGTQVADNSSNTYSTTESVSLSLTSCTSADIKVGTVLDSTLYTIAVNTDSYGYTSGVGATEESIIEGLRALITTQTDYKATKNTAGDILTIDANTDLASLTVTLSADLVAEKVTAVGSVQNDINGAIQALANSITTITTPVSGLDSVNNPVALTLGREEETDTELRQRHTESVQVAGTATVEAIQASLRKVQGVTQALVVENRSNVTDGDGRPPKSYECVVEGGTEDNIGQTVWDTKPAGVETYGSILNVVTDVDGNSQSVYFSRPKPSYIWFEVEYTLYDEESFPTNGEDAIKEAVVAFGKTLGLGNDVIPKRFFGTVYTSVAGIEDLTIRVATSGEDPNTTPATFTENPIDISPVEISQYDTSRITVTLV